MTQATGPESYAAPWEGGAAEQKTSVMAVTALVLSLICFIPGLSVLAIILGIAALLVISRSGGRVRGSGLAIAGLIIGLLVSVGWVTAAIGMAQVTKMFTGQLVAPAATSLKALESGDLPGARQIFSTSANASISDDSLTAFKDAYTAELGKFQGVPQSLLEIIEGYSQVGPLIQPYQGRNDVFPVPAKFEKGMALVVLEMDTTAMNSGQQTASGRILVVKNIQIVTATGKKIDLSALNGPPPTPAPAPGGTPEKEPETPDSPPKK
jgi:hypothetical protein